MLVGVLGLVMDMNLSKGLAIAFIVVPLIITVVGFTYREQLLKWYENRKKDFVEKLGPSENYPSAVEGDPEEAKQTKFGLRPV